MSLLSYFKRSTFKVSFSHLTVDMRGGVLKELSAKWLIVFYDHMQANPDIVINSYEEVGYIEAIVIGDDGLSISPPDT